MTLSQPQKPVREYHDVESFFTAIFEAEFAYVWKVLLRLGVQSRDLEDLTHDVFIQVHRRLPAYDRTRHIRPWLFAFAFRTASDYRKRRGYRNELLVEAEPADDGCSPEESLQAKEKRAEVMAALATLDFDRRAVLVAHDLEDCSMPDVAAALGIGVNTAYSRLRLAREQFSKAITRLRARQEKR